MIWNVDTGVLFGEAMSLVKGRLDISLERAEDLGRFREGIQVWQQFFANQKISVAVAETALEQLPVPAWIDQSKVSRVWVYAFTGITDTMTDEEKLSRQYVCMVWQGSLMDATREWIGQRLRQQEQFVSPSFGPGYFGIPMKETGTLLACLGEEAASLGIRAEENGQMWPVDSLTGIFVASRDSFAMPSGDCQSCMGTGNCQLCQHFQREKKQEDGQ